MRKQHFNLSNVTNQLYEKVRKNQHIDDEKVFHRECAIPLGASSIICQESVEIAFSNVLGIEPYKEGFVWQKGFLSSMWHSYFKIGLNVIEITSGKSLDLLVAEVESAIRDGIGRLDAEDVYWQELKSDGDFFCMGVYPQDVFLSWDVDKLVEYINEGLCCDEEFEQMIHELGYSIKEGEHPSLGTQKYIDIDKLVRGAKIWLVVGVGQNTLYRSVELRPRVEVLYILSALKYGENLFSDEY